MSEEQKGEEIIYSFFRNGLLEYCPAALLEEREGEDDAPNRGTLDVRPENAKPFRVEDAPESEWYQAGCWCREKNIEKAKARQAEAKEAIKKKQESVRTAARPGEAKEPE